MLFALAMRVDAYFTLPVTLPSVCTRPIAKLPCTDKPLILAGSISTWDLLSCLVLSQCMRKIGEVLALVLASLASSFALACRAGCVTVPY